MKKTLKILLHLHKKSNMMKTFLISPLKFKHKKEVMMKEALKQMKHLMIPLKIKYMKNNLKNALLIRALVHLFFLLMMMRVW